MICARSSSQAAFGATSLLYHIRFDLSRGFWKVFWKFSRFFSNRSLTARRKCPTIISHLFPFVKRFFKSFFNFFRDPFGMLPFGKRPAYYITSLSVCQEVSRKFFNLFRDSFGVSLHRPTASFASPAGASRSVLAYYSTSPSNCQGVFFNFFYFGTFGTLS